MEMTINDAIFRYNLISVAKFIDGEYSLPRELKIKLIHWKLNLEKIKDEFVSFQEKAIEEIKTEEYENLVNTEDKTPEEIERLNEVVNSLNEELGKLISNKTNEIVEINSFNYLTEEEFSDFLGVNIENTPIINEKQLDSNTYIELFYKNFVK